MQKLGRSVKSVNLEFYEQAYSGKYAAKSLLKHFLSYDQLSKTRRNLQLVSRNLAVAERLSILDYGFGHGTFLMRIPRRHQISGCELSIEAIKNVRKLCTLMRREASLYSSDEFFVASRALKFDLVCCSHVIEHVEEEGVLVELFHSLLNPNGHLLLNVPINEVWVDPNHVRKYTAESVEVLLTKSGFSVEEVLEADRWTAWILNHEHAAGEGRKFLLRIVRVIFGILPIRVLDFLEMVLPQNYKAQQLLVLARKR